MKKLFVILLLFPLFLIAKEKNIVDISDTNVKKNYCAVELNSQGVLYVSAYDYDGGGVYKSSLLKSNNHFETIYDNKEVFLFSLKILDFNSSTTSDDIILAGGYLSKCLCGVLLRRDNVSGQWREIYFDDIDNPFVSNIFSISTNTNNRRNSFSRIFLGCTNGIIYYSDDNAISFKKANITAGNSLIKKISFVNKSTGYAIIGKDRFLINQLYKTSDSGRTWKKVIDFSNDYIAINDISVSGDTVLLVGSQLTKGILLFSINAGKTFVNIKYMNSIEYPRALISGSLSDKSIYAVDEAGAVFKNETDIYISQKVAEGIKSEKFMNAYFNKKIILIYGFDGKIYKFDK